MLNCIATEKLQPGMVIVQVTKQNGPVKIRKSGLVSSQEMILGLLEMGIQEVQIDPAQTVEIEAQVVQSSATMQLLQQQSPTQFKADNPAHDHFNRSLFLPSVQDIPSQWQLYAKRALVMSFVVMGGLGIGFGAGYLPSLVNFQSPLVVASANDGSGGENTMLEAKPSNVAALPTPNVATLSPPEAQPGISQNVVPKASEQIDPIVATVSVPQPIQPVTTPPNPIVQNAADAGAAQAYRDDPVASQTQTSAEPLSPELLKRFEKVIQQMDREERYTTNSTQPSASREPVLNQSGPVVDLSEFPILDETSDLPDNTVPSPREKNVEDVPRIDQLPDWLIAELPSMAFSAHMYASVAAERWVRVNGQNRREGELIDDKVRIVQIAPQHVILHYAGHEFSMAAMTDW